MIYLDSASTTKISKPVFEAMVPWLTNNYGNPSSHHELGRRAKDAIEEARAIIAAAINASPEEIYFTSGGTEANNWAIKEEQCDPHIAAGRTCLQFLL